MFLIMCVVFINCGELRVLCKRCLFFSFLFSHSVFGCMCHRCVTQIIVSAREELRRAQTEKGTCKKEKKMVGVRFIRLKTMRDLEEREKERRRNEAQSEERMKNTREREMRECVIGMR